MNIQTEITGLDTLEDQFANLPAIIEAGVKVEGHAVDYWAEWEWGSARIHKPGPKTTWGENPDGERVVLTLTAPHGFVHVHHEQYAQFLQEEFARLDWGSASTDQWPQMINQMLSAAAARCSQLISDSAPIDTGLLRASIHPVEPGDDLLNDDSDEDSWQT